MNQQGDHSFKEEGPFRQSPNQIAKSAPTDWESGILPVYKSAGYTSFDVVSWVRKTYEVKKVGHAGTLDPAAEGVLPVCIGKATRLVDYLHQFPKTYEGTMVLGATTDTLDQTGRILEQMAVPELSREKIEQAFVRFTGTYKQVPPMYSAVKIQGKKLYEWARSGKEVPRQAREVIIHQLLLQGVRAVDKMLLVDFWVKCSKGTYIRSLVADIGSFLGLPAHMNRLKRIQSGPFTLQESLSLPEIEQAKREGRLSQLLHPMDAALSLLPALYLDAADATAIGHGKKLLLSSAVFPAGEYPDDTYRAYRSDGQFVAVCKGWRQESCFVVQPEKVFYTSDERFF